MEIWEARRIDCILDAGRTHPLIVECVGPQSENPERRSFLVKALSLPEITETSLGCELFGNLLARKLRIDTPEPVLVHLSSAFVDATRQIIEAHSGLRSKGAKLLAGYGAGCEYLSPGFSPIIPATYLTENELHQAARIYAFDLMAQNPDRSFEADRRPNCAYFGHRLIAYDFELCFSFVYLFANMEKAWEVSKQGIGTHHIFYRQLREGVRGGKVDFHPFIADVAALDMEELIQTMQTFPAGWTRYAEKIETHLKEIVENTPALELELYRSLT